MPHLINLQEHPIPTFCLIATVVLVSVDPVATSKRCLSSLRHSWLTLHVIQEVPQ